MRISRPRLLVAVTALALLMIQVPAVFAGNSPDSALAYAQPAQPPRLHHGSRTVHLTGRDLEVSNIAASSADASGRVRVTLDATLTNTGKQPLKVASSDFYLSAGSDILGRQDAFIAALSGTASPGLARAGVMSFQVPATALNSLSLFYRSASDGVVGSVPLTDSAAGQSASASVAAPTNGDTIEDNFTRANRTGWGTTTNGDGVSNVAWGMDGDGGQSNVTITNNIGVYGYPGGINQIGIASAGATTYNGGDLLASVWVSATGHATPYISQNDCPDKSCYYGARLHTSTNVLELARRQGGGTGIMAQTAFSVTANTLYWLRLHVAPNGGSTLIQVKAWQDGASEPANWMLSYTDSNPLKANLVGAGGSWDHVGAGERISYSCFAFATTGSAACGASGTPTPTPTVTNTPTPTSTGTPPSFTISRVWLTGGVGEPWGTAIDASGNIWFAEPGCDFTPTCPSSTPPGQIGFLAAGSSSPQFWTLPNITGNQPIFVALDSSGNVWFTTPNNSKIGEFNPSTQTFVGQWAVTAGSGPWDLTVSGGQIWYTEHYVSSIGEFRPLTHKHRDFATPTPSSLPYGISTDPTHGNYIWFTENNDQVSRVAVLNKKTSAISEYLIHPQAQSGLTPHMLRVDTHGNVWWSEGWVRAIGKLDPKVATAGQCGVGSGDCVGVTEFAIPAAVTSCGGSHVSGLALQGGGQTVWFDNSLSAEIGSFTPAGASFNLYGLDSCGAHPHDGLNVDPTNQIWWDEEFNNALGELTF